MCMQTQVNVEKIYHCCFNWFDLDMVNLFANSCDDTRDLVSRYLETQCMKNVCKQTWSKLSYPMRGSQWEMTRTVAKNLRNRFGI